MFHSILVDVPEIDNPPESFELAIKFAKSQRARINLLNVLPTFEDLFSLFEDKAMQKVLQKNLDEQAKSSTAGLAKEVEAAGVSCSASVKKGSKVKKIISEVIQNEHDLLIKDMNRLSSDSSPRLGSIDKKLIRHCPCPIWLRSAGVKAESESIAVAVDAILEDPLHERLNFRLIHAAKALAAFYGVTLKILHVWHFDQNGLLRGSIDQNEYSELFESGKELAKKRFEDFLKAMGVNDGSVEPHLVRGTPSAEILDFCAKQKVGTLVIGTVGRSGLSGVLVGNTVERVIEELTCSLLVVSPKQIQSPVEVSVREELESGVSAFSTA